MEVRAPIEVEVAKLAAERREEKHVAVMDESLQTMRANSNSAEVFSDADKAFHQAIIDASGNLIFGIMIRSIIVNLHISRQLTIRHFGIEVVIQEHEKIYEAIKNKQPSVAAIKMKEHMDGALKRINQINDLLNKQQ
jgi:GntR family transcriptional repressor for pyruvate dehydrogenase complex